MENINEIVNGKEYSIKLTAPERDALRDILKINQKRIKDKLETANNAEKIDLYIQVLVTIKLSEIAFEKCPASVALSYVLQQEFTKKAADCLRNEIAEGRLPKDILVKADKREDEFYNRPAKQNFKRYPR